MEITWITGVLARILLLLSHLAGFCLGMPHVLRFGESPLLLTSASNFDRSVCVFVYARLCERVRVCWEFALFFSQSPRAGENQA